MLVAVRTSRRWEGGKYITLGCPRAISPEVQSLERSSTNHCLKSVSNERGLKQLGNLPANELGARPLELHMKNSVGLYMQFDQIGCCDLQLANQADMAPNLSGAGQLSGQSDEPEFKSNIFDDPGV